MSEEMIIRHCSPTLAGIKTGNLFSCPFESAEQLMKDIRQLNRRLTARGVRIIPLRINEHTALIYVYRPKKLQQDFARDEVAEILCERGYSSMMPGRCIVCLANRLQECDDFPHEIGVFLGYPPEDVLGFIDNPYCPKMSGYWKVYGDEEKARKLFLQYRKCTDAYMHQHSNGRCLEKLTVAI